MLSKRLIAFAVLAAAAVPWSASAATDGYSASGGAGRCAYASGKVPGGSAWVEVCQDAGGYVDGSDTDVPQASPYPVISGAARVQTTSGVDFKTFTLNPSSPNQAYVTGFVMDPGMNTATISLTISTITVTLTLTAKTQAPEPWDYASASGNVHQDSDPSAGGYAYATLGGGVTREAAVTGIIRSSTKGGGSLSSAYADMSTGGGTFNNACADTSDAGGWFCF